MRLYAFPPVALTIDLSGGSALAVPIVVPRDGAIAEWAAQSGTLQLQLWSLHVWPLQRGPLRLLQSVLNTADWMFWKGGL